MSDVAAHVDCRLMELLSGLDDGDLRVALAPARGRDLSQAFRLLGLPISANRPQARALLARRIPSLSHVVARELAAVLVYPLLASAESRHGADIGHAVRRLALEPAPPTGASPPPGLVRLAVEVAWHVDELSGEVRDSLLDHLESGVDTPTEMADPRVDHEPRDSQLSGPQGRGDVLGCCSASPLDRMVERAVDAARAGGAGAAVLADSRAAVEELLVLDPTHAVSWYRYGLLLGQPDSDGADTLVPALPTSRLALLLGRLEALADRPDDATLATVVEARRGDVVALVGYRETAGVTSAVLRSCLDRPADLRALLERVRSPFPGWQRFVGDVLAGAAEPLDRDAATISEAVLGATRAAVARWQRAGTPAGRELSERSAQLQLLRARCRRRRRDFVGAEHLLGGVDRDALDAAWHAEAACETGLVTGELRALGALAVPAAQTERRRVGERLRRAAPHFHAALACDPACYAANVALGVLAAIDGDDRSTVARIERALGAVADAGTDDELGDGVAFAYGLARLRLLEPGTDDGAFDYLLDDLTRGYAPGDDAVIAAVEALEAHGSPRVGELLAAAPATPGPALTTYIIGRARSGDAPAAHLARRLGTSSKLALAPRFELLEAALLAGERHRDNEWASAVADEIEETLVRARDPVLDARWAADLVEIESLRAALEPLHADLARLEVCRRLGRLDEAQVIGRSLFFASLTGVLAGVDPAELHALLAELGAEPDDLANLAQLFGSDDAPATVMPGEPLRIVFVGGNETQGRYRPVLEDTFFARYGGQVSVEWFLTGWSSNWAPDLERIEVALGRADALVLMTFVRTMFGQRVRKAAGDYGVPWVACTGHGRTSIERAVDQAVRVATALRDRCGVRT